MRPGTATSLYTSLHQEPPLSGVQCTHSSSTMLRNGAHMHHNLFYRRLSWWLQPVSRVAATASLTQQQSATTTEGAWKPSMHRLWCFVPRHHAGKGQRLNTQLATDKQLPSRLPQLLCNPHLPRYTFVPESGSACFTHAASHVHACLQRSGGEAAFLPGCSTQLHDTWRQKFQACRS